LTFKGHAKVIGVISIAKGAISAIAKLLFEQATIFRIHRVMKIVVRGTLDVLQRMTACIILFDVRL